MVHFKLFGICRLGQAVKLNTLVSYYLILTVGNPVLFSRVLAGLVCRTISIISTMPGPQRTISAVDWGIFSARRSIISRSFALICAVTPFRTSGARKGHFGVIYVLCTFCFLMGWGFVLSHVLMVSGIIKMLVVRLGIESSNLCRFWAVGCIIWFRLGVVI